ncbi:MAG TPA: OsmC family protein [Vicinamibacterales bacterium]|jgi:uncharacterized OsmC-like protein|nr:OsmC family protein [Vicinamibacterales bacterium]
MADDREHHVTVTLARGYEFVAEFPDSIGSSAVLLDEPQPLGGNRGPNAAALLGAAVGDCLAASLAFCLRKSRATVVGMTARVTTHVARDDARKFRISGIDVELTPEVADADTAKLDRCEHLFEDFCIVTESVRKGIPVNVTVEQPHGTTV